MGCPPVLRPGTLRPGQPLYRDWDPISRDPAATDAWLREWVYGLDGRAAYAEKLGQERLDSLRPSGSAPLRRGRLRGVPLMDAERRAGVEAGIVFTKSEMMIVAAARELAGQRGLLRRPSASRTSRSIWRSGPSPPTMELVYEAGVFGARPARLPLSIGDPTIVTGATAVTSMWELFAYYLQGGLIDVGFLGAAQIDRFGNINTTVIGDYTRPRTRLPGSGGACEIAINARQIFVIMRQSRSLVRRPDRLPDLAGEPRRRGEVRADPARAGLAGPGPIRRGHGPRDLALRRDRRDAPGLPPSGRHARRSPRDARLDAARFRLAGSHAGADGGGASAHPRRAGPGGDVHEVGECQPPRRAGGSARRAGEDVRRSHHHDRAPGMPDHVVGDAAQEESPDRAALVRAHDDQVRVLGGGGLHDRFAGVAIPGHAGRDGARRARALGDALHREDARGSDLGRTGARGDHDQPAAQPRRQLDRLLLGCVGRARGIGREQGSSRFGTSVSAASCGSPG